MSIEVISLVMSRKVGSPTKKAILIIMADAANDDGTGIWISKPNIGRKAEIHADTVSRNIKELIKSKVLIEAGRVPCGNGYTVDYSIDIKVLKSLELTRRKMHPPAQCPPDTPAQRTLTPPHSAPLTVKEPLGNQTTTTSAGEKISFITKLIKASNGVIDEKNTRIYTDTLPASWVTRRNAADLELDVLPTITRLSQSKGKNSIGTWKYYHNAIFEARDIRIASENYENPEPKEINGKRINNTNNPAHIGNNRRKGRAKRIARREADGMAPQVREYGGQTNTRAICQTD